MLLGNPPAPCELPGLRCHSLSQGAAFAGVGDGRGDMGLGCLHAMLTVRRAFNYIHGILRTWAFVWSTMQVHSDCMTKTADCKLSS